MHIIQAPKNTILTVDELFENYVNKLLISEQQMEQFHREILQYYEALNPIFLIRKVKDDKRGLIYENALGHHIKPTDNSPSWWLHHNLYHKMMNDFSTFNEFIDNIPCHMFDIKLKGHVNHAGWHVAHIFNAKDRRTNTNEWSHDELLKKTLRNIHPCNYFYIPKTNWQRNGGDSEVIAYFYDKFKNKYSTVFEEFESIVNPDGQRFKITQSEIMIDTFERKKETNATFKNNQKEPLSKVRWPNKKTIRRLAFHASEIEKLADHDSFEIITDNGTFRMTKKEFYSTFENVTESKSYRVDGFYHYPKTPKKALQYLFKN